MRYGCQCSRPYFSWNRVVNTMIELSCGGFARLPTGTCVELIAEYLGPVGFIGLALRLIKPSRVDKDILTLRLLFVQRAPVHVAVNEARFMRVTWQPDYPPFWRRLCFRIAEYLKERRSSRPTVTHLLKAMSGNVLARFSDEDLRVLKVVASDSGVFDLELPDRRYWPHALKAFRTIDEGYEDVLDMYNTSAASVVLFVIRFVTYIVRICSACKRLLEERGGFRVDPRNGVQQKNRAGLWFPDPERLAEELALHLAARRQSRREFRGNVS